MRRTIWGWLPLAVVTAGIGVLSVVPPPTMPTGDFQFGDKINHAAAMLTVVVLVVRAIRWRRGARNRGKELWTAALYALTFSVLIEVVQGWLPDRSSDLADLIADVVGIALGVIAVVALDATPLKHWVLGPRVMAKEREN